MLKAAKFNKLDNFISGWYIDLKVCDDLIKMFEKNPNKAPGRASQKIDVTKKMSTDLSIDLKSNEPEIKAYYKELKKVIEKYKKKYMYSDKWQDAWGIVEKWNIQKYNPGEGYFALHCERSGLNTTLRHLVFMTYLNNVTDKGQTEWYYQKLKIKPEKGLTVIWGTDWTFMHKGIASPTQEKYIATGWYSYIK
jgi:prolyl 4-hydroxylase